MQFHARSLTLLSFILIAQQTFAAPLPCHDAVGCEVAPSGIKEGDLDFIPHDEGYALRALARAYEEQGNAVGTSDDLDDVEDWADYAMKRGLLRRHSDGSEDGGSETEGSESDAPSYETNAHEDARRRRDLARIIKPLSNRDLGPNTANVGDNAPIRLNRRHDDDEDASEGTNSDTGSDETGARDEARRALSALGTPLDGISALKTGYQLATSPP